MRMSWMLGGHEKAGWSHKRMIVGRSRIAMVNIGVEIVTIHDVLFVDVETVYGVIHAGADCRDGRTVCSNGR